MLVVLIMKKSLEKFVFTHTKNAMRIKKEKTYYKLAFTLAEILIIIGIIGVLACCTIPTLLTNYQNQQYVATLKKTYTEWSQATLQMASDGGCPSDLSCFFDSFSISTIGTKVVNYFNVTKDCGITSAQNDCFPSSVLKNYDGSGGTLYPAEGSPNYSFITADGVSVRLINALQGCIGSFGSGKAARNCLTDIDIDVNGLKGPNILGRDVFIFSITNGMGPAFVPLYGTTESYTYPDWKKNGLCGVDKAGNSCAARKMGEGWQMNY